jgi:hypothetical protein
VQKEKGRNNMSNMFRLLRADEIDVRAQSVNENGTVLLLYKDARCDMNILDEHYSPFNWQRTHVLVGNNLHCIVSIWDEIKGQWVSKQDVGVESNTEATKGEASDSFKRACFNWGIGRELYTAPFIFVKLEKTEVKQNGTKYYLQSGVSFSVKEIDYDDNRRIVKLVIVDNKGNVRFSFGSNVKVKDIKAKHNKDVTEEKQEEVNTEVKVVDNTVKEHLASSNQVETIKKLLNNDPVKIEYVIEEYKVDGLMKLTIKQASEIIQRIKAKQASKKS